jgi:predicted helicase
VVDFIIRSVDEVLRSEFGQTLGSEGVHILDPFTGTGTFITRLLQSGLIRPEELEHKYRHEIHANEIVLLAYYIAAINIEAAYHGVAGGEYVPFEGICLTDTFQLYEQDRDLISDLMADNSQRRTRQKELDIRVIVGNPPYSEGQESGDDNAKNLKYNKLDQRIRDTYGARSKADLQNSLFNSYVRSIRWASDRIGDQGVVAFVSAAGWISNNSFDGFRKSIVGEFSNIHVFHLRGNQRTSGDRSRREGGKVFGSGSRSPVAITVLVKNPDASEQGLIRFHDIGDYLGREEKLAIVSRFGSIGGIERAEGWRSVSPDEHGDWLSQRDSSFDHHIVVATKEKHGPPGIFADVSSGIKTNRDPWCYNASKDAVSSNMERMIAFYNSELDRYASLYSKHKSKPDPENVVSSDSAKIKWTRETYASVKSGRVGLFNPGHVMRSVYRPFTTEWAYFDRHFNNCVYQMPSIFPYDGGVNRVIAFSGPGAPAFSVVMCQSLPNYDLQSKGLCLPRYIYPESDNARSGRLFAGVTDGQQQHRDAITDEGLAHFQAVYPGEIINKDDLFHYVYGLLHSEDYRARYADNLSKELPRIPAVKTAADFWAFVEAGRCLGDLHCDYEAVEPYPLTFTRGDVALVPPDDPERFYRVEQMKFAGKRPNLDKTTVVYNANITMTGIPLEAYDYVVNGKSALEWVMERQCVKTDKASGIVNDANRYAIETVGDPAYPLKLFQRVITVSLETMKIVRGLPALDIAGTTAANQAVTEPAE